MKSAVLAVLTLVATLAGCAAPGLGEQPVAASGASGAAPVPGVLAPFSGIDRLDPKGPWVTKLRSAFGQGL